MRCRLVLGMAAALALGSVAGAEEAYRTGWTRQLGTADRDWSNGVAADASGNVFISGMTAGSLDGPNAGGEDAFVVKHDPAGELLWTRQLGTADADVSYGVAVDAGGGVFISGSTFGDLGGANAGGEDVFAAAYDSAGSLLWTRQMGTPALDRGYGVAVDAAGSVFIGGSTCGSLDGPNAGGEDVFVAKYDPAGSPLWTRQLGTPALDRAYGVAADASGNVLISGYTQGDLDGPTAGGDDAFVAKYDAAGSLLWTDQLGTADLDKSFAVAADASGNVFIGGHTYGDLGGPNAGYADIFVSKYDPAGNRLWTRQLGTEEYEWSRGLAADGFGNVFISGLTYGSLGGPSAGDFDAFVAKYDPAGNLLWTRQPGTPDFDSSEGVAVDASGNLFITGYTDGSLGGPDAGSDDAFVVRFLPPPLPPGDANLDACVDGLDYNLWSLHYLGSAGWCEGDFNNDMIADGLDYNLWSLNYLGGGEGAAVPEPASAALLILGFWVVARPRQRQRSEA